ncbi:TetR/AcrR family transcriptional regulator [Streptomyces avicenniae]|uniref:TetR/AcrR family transcriptional regulator n=1 Tax=Streptomyces avicenniae TaxID=500153 RepID=UPI00069CB505|nr:TetR/AcrR family transcriptional regulator [Streptomyces avicenniae]
MATPADRVGADTTQDRPLRADARRNRAHILDVARDAFAGEGLSVPVQEIARRAGVGTGTVSRHFPTKEALFVAVLSDRFTRHVQRAHALADTAEPGEAFLSYFAFLVQEAALDRGLADAMRGAGFDFASITADPARDVPGALRELLLRAQKSGGVRADIDMADVSAMLIGCLSRAADDAGRRRVVEVVLAGLRAAG